MSRISFLILLFCVWKIQAQNSAFGNRRVPASAVSINEELYKHRSAICLIHQLAQKNNITIKYTLIQDPPTSPTPINVAASTTPRPHLYSFRLTLGNEEYRASGTSKTKSKEKVSREAYDKTHYPKPHLRERTCAQNASRSVVTMLYEYAALNGSTIYDRVDHISTVPSQFRVELNYMQTATSGIGFSIKAAKLAAAEKLIALIGKENVLYEITKKYNSPEYYSWSNVDRLNLILAARGEPPIRFSLQREVTDSSGTSSTYLIDAESDSHMTSGSGKTLDESHEDAAGNYLKMLHFTVQEKGP